MWEACPAVNILQMTWWWWLINKVSITVWKPFNNKLTINSVITISLTSNCRSASFHDECLTFMFLLMALVPDNFLAGPSFTLKHYNALTKKKPFGQVSIKYYILKFSSFSLSAKLTKVLSTPPSVYLKNWAFLLISFICKKLRNLHSIKYLYSNNNLFTHNLFL